MAATRPCGPSGHVIRPGNMPVNVKMELLEPLEQQAQWKQEDGTAGAAGAAGTAEAEDNGSESSLEVATGNVQWVAELPRFPDHHSGAI